MSLTDPSPCQPSQMILDVSRLLSVIQKLTSEIAEFESPGVPDWILAIRLEHTERYCTMIRMLFLSFEASCRESTVTTEVVQGGVSTTTVSKTAGRGDVDYLDCAMTALEQILELWGISKPSGWQKRKSRLKKTTLKVNES